MLDNRVDAKAAIVRGISDFDSLQLGVGTRGLV